MSEPVYLLPFDATDIAHLRAILDTWIGEGFAVKGPILDWAEELLDSIEGGSIFLNPTTEESPEPERAA